MVSQDGDPRHHTQKMAKRLQVFGEDGFEKMVDHVAQIERMIGIDDLAKFTPA